MVENTSIKEALIINNMDEESQALDDLISDLKAMKAAMNKVKRLAGRLGSNSENLQEEIKDLSSRLNEQIKIELEDAENARELKGDEILNNLTEEEKSEMQLSLLLGFNN